MFNTTYDYWAEQQNLQTGVRKFFILFLSDSLSHSNYLQHPPSVLCGEDLYGLQQVEGQTVLSVVLRQYLDQTTDQPAGLGQRDQGTLQLTWVLQNKPHFQLKMTRWFI